MYTFHRHVSSVLNRSAQRISSVSIVATDSTRRVSQTGLSCRTNVPYVGRTRVTTRRSSLKKRWKKPSGQFTRMRSAPSNTTWRRLGRARREHFFLAAYHMPEQCTGLTRRGVQCKRQARPDGTTCGTHCATSSGQCPVCLDEMGRGRHRTLECGHTFHLRCLDRWKRMSRTCPMCRVPFDQPQYKVRVSVQRVRDDHTSTHTYTTSNVAGLVSSFGIDPFVDPRFQTDILFEVADDEILADVLEELGLRMMPTPDAADSASGTVPVPSGPPGT